MKNIDAERLLASLWDAVADAGGRPSADMVLDMARRAGAKFDDKSARAVLKSRGLSVASAGGKDGALP
jgi:hypothetical protein